ncbi:unnamed protein product, partial [Tetraodon nigroviridis]
SISPKMAADVGSMFQYWKKFDLRRLQVSASPRARASFRRAAPRPRSPPRPVPFWGQCAAEAGGVCIDSD